MENKRVIATGFNMPLYFWGQIGNDYSGLRQQARLTFRKSGMPDFVFPIDPFVSLSFRNVIVRRYVAKGTTRGTIKERWTEDDVEVTISGVFISENENEYPTQVSTLMEIFAVHESVEVQCAMLNDRGITRIAIESIDLPHTKSMDAQAFEIKAFSDDVFEFLQYNG